jgi:hypothetical protein
MVYCLEPLAYYFGMKPNEFWNERYKDVFLYCKVNLIKLQDSFKQQISLQEAVTDKLIQADSMLFKNPKIIPIRKMFSDLFKNR